MESGRPWFLTVVFDVTALTFNAVWQYARRHRLIGGTLDEAGAAAIGRRFQLALIWHYGRALAGAAFPILGVTVVVAFNAYCWLPIRGESPRPRGVA